MLRKMAFLMFMLFLTLSAVNSFAQSGPHDLACWRMLEIERQMDHVYNSRIDSNEFRLQEITDPTLSAAIVQMRENALENVDRDEIESDIHGMETIASVGEPRLSIVTLYSIEGQTVVVELHLYQAGGATLDESAPGQTHYATEEEALADGVDTGRDVNWQAKAYFAWDGKVWKAMSYTNSEGRGFSWSGW